MKWLIQIGGRRNRNVTEAGQPVTAGSVSDSAMGRLLSGKAPK
jgi:hypothetical protein